jgi:hypothetical protein
MQGGKPCIPDIHPYSVTNTRCRIGTVFSPDDGHIVAPKHVEKSNELIKKFCTKLVLFTRLYKDDWSTEHKVPKKQFYLKILFI